MPSGWRKPSERIIAEFYDLQVALLKDAHFVLSENCRDYRRDTPMGLVLVEPFGDWVAVRFAEPHRALSHFPLSMPSGKYNFHNTMNVEGSERIELFLRKIDEICTENA